MITPQEPEEEPVGDELPVEHADDHSDDLPDDRPGQRPREPGDEVPDEDAVWRAIVDNYGDRPEIDEPEIVVPPSPRDLTEPPRPTHEDPDERSVPTDPEDHFVPPPPPPLPKPPPARLLAWLGLFGVPTFVLVALVTGLALPSWLGLLLMAWFVGGFVFLVASMRPGAGEDGDNGARL